MEKFNLELEGETLEVKTGVLAPRATKALRVRYGDTEVLISVVMEDSARDVSYLPLMVDYEEKLYASGTIKGSRWVKREGKPTTEARLTSRMIDRALRPRFDQGIRNDLQIITTVLSMDEEYDPDIPALIGSSLALHLSSVPWDGSLGAVRVGRVEGEWILNPTFEEREEGDCDLVVAGDQDVINMLEYHGEELTKEEFLEGVKEARDTIEKLVEFQNELQEKIGDNKEEPIKQDLPEELAEEIEDFLSGKIGSAIHREELEVHDGTDDLKENLFEHLEQEYGDEFDLTSLKDPAEQKFKKEIEEFIVTEILEDERRPDGRDMDEIRPLQCETDMVNRPHGSALFARGLTQAVSIVTLGGPDLEQMFEEMEGESTKRYLHHYNFPPFSVGEVQPLRGPGRREIGHGMLAERALRPLIPGKEEFPYTIRVVSEITSSNGSSSMASVCGSTLSLLDAGVKLKANAAGVAMGIVEKGDDYEILTDIQGPEDHYGGMDLKVAGTRSGITAVQMDVKIDGLTEQILEEAFNQAKEGRLQILDKMEAEKSEAGELSSTAPKVKSLEIDPNKIRNVIGPGGKIVRQISEETGADLDIEESGKIFITADTNEEVKEAETYVKNIVREIEVGEEFKGEVVKTTDFGAFVEIAPGRDGLIHISNLSSDYVEDVEDVLEVGDKVKVKVKKVDEDGKIGFDLISTLS